MIVCASCGPWPFSDIHNFTHCFTYSLLQATVLSWMTDKLRGLGEGPCMHTLTRLCPLSNDGFLLADKVAIITDMTTL